MPQHYQYNGDGTWTVTLNGRVLGVRDRLTTAVDLLAEALDTGFPECQECGADWQPEHGRCSANCQVIAADREAA
jgi:hypothetical protein